MKGVYQSVTLEQNSGTNDEEKEKDFLMQRIGVAEYQ